MGFGPFDPGCSCCCVYTVPIRGCTALFVGQELGGATATLDDGAGGTYSATSDAAGNALISHPGPGTYTLTVTGGSRFLDSTPASVTISACTETKATAVTLAPNVAGGYRCPCSCSIPIPNALSLTSSLGSATLNYNTTTADWRATITVGSGGFTGCTGGRCSGTASGGTLVTFTFCAATLRIAVATCPDVSGNLHLSAIAGCGSRLLTVSNTDVCVRPLSATGTFTDPLGQLSGGSFTLSE